MTIKISALTIYPVKSCAGINLTQSKLEPMGLRYDRRWMIVDIDGRFLSQRNCPQMALIKPEIKKGRLHLTHPELKPLKIPEAGNTLKQVTIWEDTVSALTFYQDIDAWLGEALGRPCQLVTMSDTEIRECDQNYAKPGEHTSFADAFPLLLISQASLDDLNSRLDSPVEMRRFRPNLVVTGTEAYAEDSWKEFTVVNKYGDIQMRAVKLCSRCPIPTINPDSGVKEGHEPLKTLASYRKKGNQVYFGQNVIHQQTGSIRTGDLIHLL